MKFHAVLAVALATVASARQIVPDYQPASAAAASGDGYGQQQQQQQAGGYGQPQRKCTAYFDTETRDQCEDFKERVCSTTHQEKCVEDPMRSCTAQVNSQGGRKCFDVEERQCNLREEARLQTIQVPVTVQKCRKEMERVCDTSYEVNSSGSMARQCVSVDKPYCKNVQKVLQDRICRTTTKFDCDKSLPDVEEPGYPQTGGYDSGAAASGGYGEPQPQQQQQYSTTTGYGEQKVQCRRSQSTSCQDIPRTVTMRECQQRTEQVCRDLDSREPTLQAKQNCREVPRRVCELLQRQQPKQVKVFSYKQECRKVPRKVCASQASQTLQPACSRLSNRRCSYSPAEHCDDEPKRHCFKVTRRVKKQRCENVGGYGPQASSGGYEAPAATGY